LFSFDLAKDGGKKFWGMKIIWEDDELEPLMNTHGTLIERRPVRNS
jgi:hypothetical protein